GAAEGLPGESSGAVHVDSDGRTWFAPMQGGLYWLKDSHVGSIPEAGLNKDVVYSIAGGNGELWVARKRGGLTHLENVAGRGQRGTKPVCRRPGPDRGLTVAVARTGPVWARDIM